MLTLLWTIDHAQCSDSRDKLYAIYSLATDLIFTGNTFAVDTNLSDNNRPMNKGRLVRGFTDYDASFEEVYTHFAEMYITAGRFDETLTHLLSFGSSEQRSASLPSWVPDWSKSRHSGFSRRIWERAASKTQSPHLWFTNPPFSVRVSRQFLGGVHKALQFKAYSITILHRVQFKPGSWSWTDLALQLVP
jgi:hypothetical protein